MGKDIKEQKRELLPEGDEAMMKDMLGTWERERQQRKGGLTPAQRQELLDSLGFEKIELNPMDLTEVSKLPADLFEEATTVSDNVANEIENTHAKIGALLSQIGKAIKGAAGTIKDGIAVCYAVAKNTAIKVSKPFRNFCKSISRLCNKVRDKLHKSSKRGDDLESKRGVDLEWDDFVPSTGPEKAKPATATKNTMAKTNTMAKKNRWGNAEKERKQNKQPRIRQSEV